MLGQWLGQLNHRHARHYRYVIPLTVKAISSIPDSAGTVTRACFHLPAIHVVPDWIYFRATMATQLYYWEVEWYITECSYNWWLQCPKCRLVIPDGKQQPSIWATVNQEVLNLTVQNGLYQIQHEPTRMNNILDLVFVTNINLVNNVKVYPGKSDHDCVITDIDLKVEHCRKQPRTVYRFSKGNMDAIKHDLETKFECFAQSDPSSRTVDENWNDFKTTLMSSVNKHIPRKTLSTRKDVPWMTPEIKRKIRKKQRLYNKQKKSGNAEDKHKFRELRRTVKRELNLAHNQYVLSLLDTQEPTSEGDSGKATIGRKFWKYIKSMKREQISISSLKDETTGEEITHSEGKAQILSKQFESIFTNEDSDTIPNISTERYPPMASFTITTQGIENLLKKVNPRKTNGPDLIPSRVLKECAPQIAPYLTVIFSQSLSYQQLPKDSLTANICPVFKKGSRTTTSN